MNKTLIIIKREYLTRIRNKAFIFSTLFTPLFFFGIIAVSTYMSMKSSEELNIAVYDESGLFAGQLENSKKIHYHFVPKAVYDVVILPGEEENTEFDGGLFIPQIDVDKPAGITYSSRKQMGVISQERVNDDMNAVLERNRMIRADIDTAKLAAVKANPISLVQKSISEDGSDKEANAGVSLIAGYGAGFLIYFIILIYGSMVMRGVMEEKTNRIAEVIVSSVRPVQLMMGKIIGIGAVGLTQFLIWLVLLLVGYSALMSFVSPDAIQQMAEVQQAGPGMEAAKQVQLATAQLNIPLLFGAFLFYFLGGYLFYASLFAAVGSAVNDDPQDAQTMMMPVTMPIILSIVILTSAINNPTGPLAFWCSIIPFTSPVIMMARLPFGVPGTVPWWELGLSVVVLTGSFLFTTWLSARIYRTGILLYGKKVTWKEMFKWAFSKQ